MYIKSEEEIKKSWKGDETNPLVSICCITYNHEKYISDALNSFLMQETKFPFEIVIGEDCSDDKTLKIIKEYKLNYPTIIRVITSERNVGMCENFDRVIDAAQGEYIALCEGDDYFTIKDKLTINVKEMKNDMRLSFVFGPAVQINEKNDDKKIRNQYTKKEVSKIDLNWVLKKGGAFYPTPTSFFRKSVLHEKPKWFDFHFTRDYPLAILSVLKGRIGYIDKVTACYRYNEGSVSNKKFGCIKECKKSATNKYHKNLEFIKMIYKENVAEYTMYKLLAAKEDYVYYSKLINCGYRFSTLVGLFKIRYSLYYKSRLILKLAYKLIN
ncbi:putative glycosyltransferase - possibly involved in cell wall localization and side chain formation of rhamnose-glucose polysaccharide [hydrothermal vent metagenome]|uniref:Putative glycosyltransferase - possibly involved in cell wall localization and side chain formation of rhamnose-glucose polysaccharide n=1 Tax=hydrothermal vent metagenome TaxID=652676 RepID=A0A3B0Z5V1_9ZZZZ